MKKNYFLCLAFLAVCFCFSTAQATMITVAVNSSSFSPASFNCTVGDTIHWVIGSGVHTTTSTSVPSGAAIWDSPIDGTTTFFDYPVTTAGVYSYVCTPHGFTGTFTAGAAAVGSTFTVNVGGSFSPDTIFCVVGDSVKWVLQSFTHTTTATSIPIGAAVWDAPITAASPTFKYKVTTAGPYSYKCTPHNFTGTINATQVAATSITVTVNGSNFSPSSFNCNVGDTIKWVLGAGNHTTTSTSVPGGAATWDAPINGTFSTFQYIVSVAGSYDYVCTPHGFTGTFTASAAASTTQLVTVNPLAFSPSTINCIVGDTIKWQLASEVHTTTSTSVPTGASTWDAPIVAATPSFIYPVTVAGTYHYKSTPDSYTGVIIATPVGINQPEYTNAISVFPNPTMGKFQVSSLEFKVSEIEIFNVIGERILYTSGKMEIDLSNQPNGIYFVLVKANGNSFVKKLVVF